MWELMAMKIPHEGLGMGTVIRRVTTGQREEIPPRTPEPLSNIISRCWAQEAGDRPKTKDVMEELMNIEIG